MTQDLAQRLALEGLRSPKTIRRRGRGLGLDETAAAALPGLVLAAARLLDETRARQQAEENRLAAEAATLHRRQAQQRPLYAAARAARQLGFVLRASRARDGRISSYYGDRVVDGARIRLSDHQIPASARREAQAWERFEAGLSESSTWSYRGPAELIVDRPRTATWVRRAIILTIAGRDVPGAAAEG